MLDLNCWESKFQLCCYSNKLLNKILSVHKRSANEINILEIRKAIYYAKKYHGDQKRQSGEPYYSHPLEVAYMVVDYLLQTDIVVTSILHDTLEDTLLTKNIIDLIFGSKIASKVEDLTKRKKDKKISFIETIELLMQQKKYDILLIKCLDRLHNLQTLSARPLEKQKKTILESLHAFLMLATSLELEIEQEIAISKHSINIITKHLHKLISKQGLNRRWCINT